MPKRSTLRFNDRTIRALAVPAKGTRKYRFGGDAPRGLAIQVTAAGSRSGCLIYVSPVTRAERLVTIGQWPTWSVARLCLEAERLRRDVNLGLDPLEERERARLEVQREQQAPTVADLAKRYAVEHLPSKRPSSARNDVAMTRDYVLPALGKLRVDAVTKAQIAKLHRDVTTRAPIRANRLLALLRTMFSLSVEWGQRSDNPARGGRGGVKMNPEDHKQRFLSAAESARLTEVLADHAQARPMAVALIRVLLLTGARFGEVANATWSEIDFNAAIWIKPASNTKAKRQHVVPLNAPTLAVLAALKAEAGDNPYIFPSPTTGRPFLSIKRAWQQIRVAAGIPDCRVHDLRHNFASSLAGSGASLQLIGSLLGHSNVATTQRYAHLCDDVRRQAAECAASLIMGAGAGKPADVVTLPLRTVNRY